MTVVGIKEWLKDAKEIDCITDDYDSCGNRIVISIYEKDNEFFQVEFLNGHPHCEVLHVKKASRLEYVCEWIPKNHES